MAIIKFGKCEVCNKKFLCDFDRVDWDGRPKDDVCAVCESKENKRQEEMWENAPRGMPIYSGSGSGKIRGWEYMGNFYPNSYFPDRGVYTKDI